MGHLHIACFLSGNKAIQRGGGRELVGTVALPTETDLCVWNGILELYYHDLLGVSTSNRFHVMYFIDFNWSQKSFRWSSRFATHTWKSYISNLWLGDSVCVISVHQQIMPSVNRCSVNLNNVLCHISSMQRAAVFGHAQCECLTTPDKKVCGRNGSLYFCIPYNPMTDI